jgi:hypothetical protein
VVGEAAGSGGPHTDQIAFVGSVGTTVEGANDLRLVTGDGDTVRAGRGPLTAAGVRSGYGWSSRVR